MNNCCNCTPFYKKGCLRRHCKKGRGVVTNSPAAWLTVAKAAEYAAVSADTIYQACLRDELQHVRLGGRRHIRLKAEWVDAWLERHGSGGQQEDESGNFWTRLAEERKKS